MNISKRFYPFVVFFVCGSVIIYTALRSTNIIIGPSIEIKYPINIYETETPVNVSGVVKRSSHFYINDREIYLTRLGEFSETLPLSLGFNIIKFQAVGKSGKRSRVLYKRIVLK